MTQVKERPILFSAPMVRAILEDRKTATRRVVKGFQIPTEDTTIPAGDRQRWSAIGQKDPRYGFCIFGSTEAECAKELEEYAPCPYGRRGDRLWVRETWYCDHFEVMRGPYLKPDDLNIGEALDDGTLVYAADGLTPYEADQPIWKPSIHMPRWASRILLEITGVRVERLQDITEGQAVAEGVRLMRDGSDTWVSREGPGNLVTPWPTAKEAFSDLWNSINGPDAWEANPWVWVVEFKRVTP
ncbi:hypothetical protein [Pseudomonas sp. RL_105y_Pfl2_101]|uniref:hypothetical protein n=1 Tax=Pseudomonas sp. RL_105y_Pfl2_101 TaxID=3088708 RepID=UPI0030DD829A